jgi:hypothetical protein
LTLDIVVVQHQTVLCRSSHRNSRGRCFGTIRQAFLLSLLSFFGSRPFCSAVKWANALCSTAQLTPVHSAFGARTSLICPFVITVITVNAVFRKHQTFELLRKLLSSLLLPKVWRLFGHKIYLYEGSVGYGL